MSISHWGIIPGWFDIGNAGFGLRAWGALPAVWVSVDFETWCAVMTREPIRKWPQ